jgi:signal transduction histidine kinase
MFRLANTESTGVTHLIDDPIHLLLIEDNPGDAKLLREYLGEFKEAVSAVSVADTLEKGLVLLAEKDINAILLDLTLPDSHGLETVLHVCEQASQVPIIVLSGLADESMAVRALREGAQDYLIKDQIDANLLLRAIRYAIQRKGSELVLREIEEQLQQAQRMEAVGRLAGGIAHDFNNLLTVIEGYAKLMLETEDTSDAQRRDLTHIHQAAERAAALTRKLLTFSRRQYTHPQSMDIGEVVNDMRPMLKSTIGERIDLQLIIADDIGNVVSDRGQIEQVILNLVLNAHDAMEEGGILTIECANLVINEESSKLHPEAVAGEYVQMAVTDTGVGMPEKVKQQIFDPFFTTKPFGAGTGLGLSTVYGIVKQSGGHLWVYSEPDIGTSLKVNLPRSRTDLRLPPEPAIRTVDISGTERLLLVEDEPELLNMITTFLESIGYRLKTAANGHEAIRLAHADGHTFDLLVSDVVLPDKTGPEILEDIRGAQPEMKVLFMSAYPGDTIVQRGVIKPSTPFLSKPFAPETLGRRIREVLDAD